MTSSAIKSNFARGRGKHFAAAAALWLCLVLPSLFLVKKFLGTTSLAIYVIFAAVVVAIPT